MSSNFGNAVVGLVDSVIKGRGPEFVDVRIQTDKLLSDDSVTTMSARTHTGSRYDISLTPSAEHWTCSFEGANYRMRRAEAVMVNGKLQFTASGEPIYIGFDLKTGSFLAVCAGSIRRSSSVVALIGQ